MSKSDVIELKGTVKESLPNAQFKVVLDNGHQILDNKVVDYTIEKYTSVKEILDALKNKGLYVTNSTDSVTVKEVATSTAAVVIKPGDEKLDFSKKIKDTKNQLIGFEKELTKIIIFVYFYIV